MSLQWTIIAFIMYVELVATVLLLLPFISAHRWNSLFKSRFLRSLQNMSHVYFKVFLAVLLLFFIDAIREMRKYGGEIQENKAHDHAHNLDAEMQAQMRLFRSQRNFYISGFSLFLWIAIQRLTILLSQLAVAQAEKSAALKQATSASAVASQLMKSDKTEEKSEAEITAAKELKALKEENHKLSADAEAALKQASAVTTEYDRLMEEHAKLQEDMKKLSREDEESKKAA